MFGQLKSRGGCRLLCLPPSLEHFSVFHFYLCLRFKFLTFTYCKSTFICMYFFLKLYNTYTLLGNLFALCSCSISHFHILSEYKISKAKKQEEKHKCYSTVHMQIRKQTFETDFYSKCQVIHPADNEVCIYR